MKFQTTKIELEIKNLLIKTGVYEIRKTSEDNHYENAFFHPH